MQVSQTYNVENNDLVNRENLALLCAEYFQIKDVSPCLYQIAAPASEIARINENGGIVTSRKEIEKAIPWDERSLKTFAIVYCYECTASFIGKDGKTYIVPNDKPVLDHLEMCGYSIAPYGRCFDGQQHNDTLIQKLKNELFDIDKNLPDTIVNKIEKIENGRHYYEYNQSYDGTITFGGTFARRQVEDYDELSLSEKKLCNILTYDRVYESQNIEDYVQFALQQNYLNGDLLIKNR